MIYDQIRLLKPKIRIQLSEDALQEAIALTDETGHGSLFVDGQEYVIILMDDDIFVEPKRKESQVRNPSRITGAQRSRTLDEFRSKQLDILRKRGIELKPVEYKKPSASEG